MSAYQRTNDDGTKQWHFRKRVQLPDGTKKRISGTPAINTKAAALAAERAAIELLLNPPSPKRERRLMSDVLKDFMSTYTVAANNKESERAQKQSQIDCHLEPALGKRYLDEIDEGVVDELAAKLAKTPKARGEGVIGAKTIKNVLQTLRKCLNWAKRKHWIDRVPEFQMPRIDEAPIRFLEDAELAALLETAASEPMWFAALVIAVDVGLRQGELRALQWPDINEVTNKVVVQRSRWRDLDGTPKSRKPRSVPLTRRAREALHAIRASKLRGSYVFSQASGDPLAVDAMQDAIDRLARGAKIADCGWHTLRHTFCTRLAMRGAAPKTIQELAGHASLATTMRYMHVTKGAPDAAIALLEEPSRARSGHEGSGDGGIDSEGVEVIQFDLVTPKGLELHDDNARTSTLSRACNDHTALRRWFVPDGPGMSPLISFGVAATWQQSRPDIKGVTPGLRS